MNSINDHFYNFLFTTKLKSDRLDLKNFHATVGLFFWLSSHIESLKLLKLTIENVHLEESEVLIDLFFDFKKTEIEVLYYYWEAARNIIFETYFEELLKNSFNNYKINPVINNDYELDYTQYYGGR